MMLTNRLVTITTKTTACRFTFLLLIPLLLTTFVACKSQKKAAELEEEPLSRTEFTERIENFFEYDLLKAGKQSQFLIHLTDLSDGTPVEKAEVTLTISNKSGAGVGQVKARIGKVTGIYVADVTIANPGNYDLEFHIKNAKLDERLPLKDFQVE